MYAEKKMGSFADDDLLCASMAFYRLEILLSTQVGFFDINKIRNKNRTIKKLWWFLNGLSYLI